MDVGTWYYFWERYIPFVPIMIVPYMSIDLFFAAAPFLCRSRRELHLFSKRITLGVFVAGPCFLIYPLRLATERPAIAGWLGVAFELVHRYGSAVQSPSFLHITLRTILAESYARHTRGLLHLVTGIWFSLIGFSTLLMHQHHVVDVIGGFIWPPFASILMNDLPLRLPMVRNRASRLAVCGVCLCLIVLCR